MAALATIEKRGPLTPSELADVERIQRPTATRVAAHLTERGLVQRADDPEDGRVSLLSVTAAGQALLDEVRSRKNAYLADRMDGLSAGRPRRAGARRRRARADAGRARVTAALRKSFLSLAVPNYRRYFTGQVVSLSGNWVQIVAETWLILRLTQSGVAVGLLAALQFAPMLVMGAYGGLLADRFDKRKLLMITQLGMVVPALALFAVTVSGVVTPWMVFALVLVRGSVNALDNPARQSFVIEMVGPDRVVNAVSLNSVIVHCARMVGPAIAGVLIATVGRGAVLSDQRRLVPGDAGGAAADGRRDAGHSRACAAPPTRAARRPGLRGAHAGAGGAAGDDGAGGHAGLQLPGAAAAAGQVHLRGRPRHLRRAGLGHGRGLGGRCAHRGRARARVHPGCSSAPARPSAWPPCWWRWPRRSRWP